MKKDFIVQRLAELKSKQSLIDKAWAKAGDRKLLEFFVEVISKALHVERCSIFILDPVEDNVWLHCGTGVREKQISVPKWNSMVGNVISSGKHHIEYDMEDTVGAHDTVDIKTGFITRDSLCVPVHGVSTKRITGAIQVLNKKGNGEYSDDDVRILREMALHLQMTIENLFLRQEMIKVSSKMERAIGILEGKLKQTGT